MDRRDFLRLSAAVAAAAGSGAYAAGGARPGIITGIAMAQDCVSVCTALPIATPLKNALARRLEIVALGDILPSGDRRVPALLSSGDERKIALGLGVLIAKAAAGGWAPADGGPECATYQDAHIIREFSSAGVQAMGTLLSKVDQRLHIGIHTFEPDADDVENWIVRLIDWDSQMDQRYREYSAALTSPDAAKVRRYVESVRLYDGTDPLIRAASQLRAGARLPVRELESQVGSSAESLYGKALRRAVSAVRAAPQI